MSTVCAALAMVVTIASSSGAEVSKFVLDEPGDLITAGGAAVVSAPLHSLRSGNPRAHTVAALRAVLNPAATISRVSFAYRYDTGFGPSGVGANFSLLVAGKSVYESPHLTDYCYGHNRSNYSQPVAVNAASLSIRVSAGPQPKDSHLEFHFDNNDRNLQLLLPLTILVECSGTVPCTPPPPPPPSHRLLFEQAPRIAAGPECPQVLGSGPWWDKVHALSDTHALGWAESHLMSTTDAGIPTHCHFSAFIVHLHRDTSASTLKS